MPMGRRFSPASWAENMAASKRNIPHFAYVEECDVTDLEKLRADLNANRGGKPKLTMLPLLIAAVCRALPKFPMLNARYVPMSVAAAKVFPRPLWRRLVEAQLIVDESWALAGRGGRFDRHVLVGAGLLLYVLWVASTVVGTLVGDRLGDPEDYGLDAAFAALFLGLAMPYLRSRRALEASALAARTAAAVTRSIALRMKSNPLAQTAHPIDRGGFGASGRCCKIDTAH